MCGRYLMRLTERQLMDQFALREVGEIRPRHNIAPSQSVPVVRLDAAGVRQLALLRWGLVPAWAKDPSIGSRLINARSETAATRPAFRSAMRHRRCLIPASGFYEWQTTAKGRQPWVFYLADWAGFALAGLWEPGPVGHDPPPATCTILTTAANALCRRVHDRMPVIIRPDDYARWLDPACRDAAALGDLLVPFDPAPMRCHPVSTRVNSPKNDDPALLEPTA